METLEFWMPADALALRCSVAQVGTVKPYSAAQAYGATSARELAQLCAPRAIRALLRIAESAQGLASVYAARELLDRAYGPGEAIPGPPEALEERESFPPWVPADSPRLSHAYGRHAPEAERHHAPDDA